MEDNAGKILSAGGGGKELTMEKDEATPSGEEYEVEAVVDYVKDEAGKEWYQVKWKGYPTDQNTWEPKDNLTGCNKRIKKFHKHLKIEKLNRKQYKRKRQRSEEHLEMSKKFAKLESLVDHELMPLDFAAKKALAKRSLQKWEDDMNMTSKPKKEAKIIVENDVDAEGPPQDFTYIIDYKAVGELEIPKDPLVGCECEDCYEDGGPQCCPKNSGSHNPYHKNGRVKVPPGTPIYECNKRCRCGPRCPNRVVQRGRRFKVSVFRTNNGCGWGVKTLQDIKKNSFVMEYVGEVISNEEAERRGRVYDANGRTYLFDLDYNDGDCPFTVDAGRYGNVSHFVNHSCDPNLVVYGVWIDTLDPRLPRIALFACRDIAAGEELTFDYQMTGEINSSRFGSVKLQPIKCMCGTEACRGFLF
ncbi:histone-lysine N-methyltransferase SUV39H2-like isoform X2 [Amphiura filiformis]|uniref:histone-lysine N-methyltransferase SUV39H2-like isoform X2 n=1 Tax=Amphiura filiformis TaxID=82378 RepID=UPI003B21A1D0